MDHNENCCIFDTTQYTGKPDTAPCEKSIDVPEIIRTLDSLYAQGRESEAQGFLEAKLSEARSMGDWRGELSMLSELLGQYRRSMSEEKGLRCANEALALIREHHMGETVSGATVMLNAATTMKCFGRAKDSIPIFCHVSRVYSAKLDPTDYRFPGLYNNMALSYADAGDIASAERFFKLALKLISAIANSGNDMAVTYCNMAEMYAKLDLEDERIYECMEKAWDCLNEASLPRDGYHAFTISKCAPSFDYFGYFLYAKELKERAESIYAGS
ncbi:MAG: hypothetical protein IJE09_02155 [Oscillospiraceae bacterium]|nr:hypothetical protein [Oscillospiraceae bacterium]